MADSSSRRRRENERLRSVISQFARKLITLLKQRLTPREALYRVISALRLDAYPRYIIWVNRLCSSTRHYPPIPPLAFAYSWVPVFALDGFLSQRVSLRETSLCQWQEVRSRRHNNRRYSTVTSFYRATQWRSRSSQIDYRALRKIISRGIQSTSPGESSSAFTTSYFKRIGRVT